MFITVFAIFASQTCLASAEDDKKALESAMKKIDAVMPAEVVKNADIQDLAGKAISLLLGIIGTAALIVFLYSGIMWMTSAGKAEQVAKAQKAMIWAGLGLFVVFGGYIIVKYLIGATTLW